MCVNLHQISFLNVIIRQLTLNDVKKRYKNETKFLKKIIFQRNKMFKFLTFDDM